jgi:hypothetical protein
MEKVKFHFDPRCPWCYQTSRWIRRLEELGTVEAEWGVFSLEVVNAPEGTDLDTLDAASGPPLRTAILIRDRFGAKAIGPFYAELGARIWEEVPPASDLVAASRDALSAVGLDPSIVDEALEDPETWQGVLAEHRALVDAHGSFGVPTIVLDGGTGPAIFGPVISALPDDPEAVALFEHVAWLTRYRSFFELKRGRVEAPDLPAWAWRVAQRAAEQEQGSSS